MSKDKYNDKTIGEVELWNYCMEEYENNNFLVKKLINNFFNKIYQITDLLNAESRILEMGCGAGASSNRIFNNIAGKCHFEASEFDERFVSIINNRMNYPFRVIQESVYEPQRNDNEFNMILLLEVLEHLEKPEIAIKELFRVSSEYVVISVPWEPVWRISNFLRGKYITDWGNTPGHINHYNKKRLQRLCMPYTASLKFYYSFPWLILVAQKKQI